MSRRAKHNRPLPPCVICDEREARGPLTAICARCQRKAYVADNPEKVRSQKKLHYRKYAERLKAEARARYDKNKKRLNQQKRQARRDDPNRFSDYARTRYEKCAEGIKAAARDYYHRKPHVAKAANARRRARLLNATVGVVDLELVRDQSRGICGICSRAINDNDEVHFDHVVPLSKGGAHSNDNLQLAHAICNRRKKDRLNFSL